MKARVFVSSVVDDFTEFRQAAREAIEAAGGEPVLVNEDFPSLASSSRNACLDAVDSCDYLVSIIGPRGGWGAPSGKLVVEEEYERALLRKISVVAFVQTVARDDAAERFAKRVSDYVDGAFRQTFATPDGLRDEIERALRPLFQESPPMTTSRPNPDSFANPYAVQGVAMLRMVLTPEREEEVIDPVRLGSDAFRRRIQELAHGSSVCLLSYERPKTAKVERDDLVIVQTEPNGRHDVEEHVRIQLAETGELTIDANVTGRVQRGDRYSLMSSGYVATEDIEGVLGLCFAFAAALFDELDPFKRQRRFLFNVALSALEYRKIRRNPKPGQSMEMSMRSPGVILAYEAPRLLNRADFMAPQDFARIFRVAR